MAPRVAVPRARQAVRVAAVAWPLRRAGWRFPPRMPFGPPRASQIPRAETWLAGAAARRAPPGAHGAGGTAHAPCASPGCAQPRAARTSCRPPRQAGLPDGHWRARRARNAGCAAGAAKQKRMKTHPSLLASRLWGRHGLTRWVTLVSAGEYYCWRKSGAPRQAAGRPEAEAVGIDGHAARLRYAAAGAGRAVRPVARASDGQALAALGAACVDDGTAAAGLHAHAETVGTLAAGNGRLVGTFHVALSG